jgi:hypothetical protein
MERSNRERYLFHANAVALGGQITSPFNVVIEAQGSAVLPITGGYASARVEDFRYRDLVSFRSASSTVSGSVTGDKDNLVAHSLATVTVEGLNVANVVTADLVVARLVSTLGEEVISIGSYFVNLRIAGVPFELDRQGGEAHHTTRGDVRKAQSAGPQDDRTGAKDATAKVGDAVRRERPVLTCLFDLPDNEFNARGKRTLPRGCRRVDDCGIRVPGFGTVFVAEHYVTSYSHRLTMLRIEMGCPVDGTIVINHVDKNGSPQ